MSKTLQEKCDEIIEYEFRAHELVDEVSRNNDLSEIEDAMVNSINELIQKVDTEERVLACYILMYQLGRAFESERLLTIAGEKVEEFKMGE